MLDKSFRCTNEILNFGLKFIEHRSEIKSFNRQGDSPEVFAADNSGILIDNIVTEVKQCQKKGLQSIALICKTEQNAVRLFNKLKHRLDVQLIRSGSESEVQGVFIIPVYMSKGLEFDAVLICDADSQNASSGYGNIQEKIWKQASCTMMTQ